MYLDIISALMGAAAAVAAQFFFDPMPQAVDDEPLGAEMQFLEDLGQPTVETRSE